MRIQLQIEQDYDDDPNLVQDKQKEIIINLYRRFPNAVWERTNHGYKIFI